MTDTTPPADVAVEDGTLPLSEIYADLSTDPDEQPLSSDYEPSDDVPIRPADEVDPDLVPAEASDPTL